MEIFEPFRLSCSVYGTLLIIYGWITNSLVSLTCFSKRLNKYPSFVLIGFDALIDNILLTSGLDIYWNDFFGYGLLSSSVNGLKFDIYISTIFKLASSTVLIYMSVERIQTMRDKTGKKFNFSSKKIGYGVLLLFIVLAFVNTPLFFVELHGDKNMTIVNEFFAHPLASLYYSISVVLTVFIPIPVLTITNGYLIYLIMSKNKNTQSLFRESNRKRRSISVSIAVMTLLFVILNLPYAVSLLLSTEFESENFIYIRIYMTIGATFHAISFVSLYITNQEFRNSFRQFIKFDASVFPTST